jgi:hypothetical protein
MNKKITIVHGVSSLTKEVPAGYTFGELRSDPTIRAALGTSDNVRALLDGTAMNDTAVIPPDVFVRLETATNVKA